MIRERALKILLVLVGLACLAGLYPLLTSLPHAWNSGVSIGDQMILSIYITLGVFLLLAVRNPSAHRSLIAFTGWSSLAHDSVMIVQSYQAHTLRADLPPLGLIAIIAVAFILLTPPKPYPAPAASPAA